MHLQSMTAGKFTFANQLWVGAVLQTKRPQHSAAKTRVSVIAFHHRAPALAFRFKISRQLGLCGIAYINDVQSAAQVGNIGKAS